MFWVHPSTLLFSPITLEFMCLKFLKNEEEKNSPSEELPPSLFWPESSFDQLAPARQKQYVQTGKIKKCITKNIEMSNQTQKAGVFLKRFYFTRNSHGRLIKMTCVFGKDWTCTRLIYVPSRQPGEFPLLATKCFLSNNWQLVYQSEVKEREYKVMFWRTKTTMWSECLCTQTPLGPWEKRNSLMSQIAKTCFQKFGNPVFGS